MTKKQRNDIYTKSIVFLETEALSGNRYAIYRTLLNYERITSLYGINRYPEMLLFEPEFYGLYWLPLDEDGFFTRLIILDFCINMTS